MKRRILLALLAILLTPHTYSQAQSNAAKTLSPLERVAIDIKEERPKITYETLLEDETAVRASFSAIWYTYSKMELDSDVAAKAVMFGWKQLRLGPLEPTTALTPRDLINFLSELGVLVIKSTPPGAKIEVDGKMLADPTEAVHFSSPGEYRIRLSLAGYEPIEETCQVTKEKKTEFSKVLTPLKKKKPK